MAKIGVIGGGFGGIAAALRMRGKGHEVVLFDRCSRLGGRAQVFSRDGYRFDAGPTVITAPFLLEELFALFSKRMTDYLDMVPLDPWYRFVFSDGEVFDYGGTVDDTLARIARISPQDVAGYKGLLEESRRIFTVGFEQLADQPFHRLSTMIGQIPAMIRLGSYRSMYSLVCRHLVDDRLRQAFSIQPLLVGGNPLDTTCIYGLIHYLERKWGIHFVMGGTGALIDALAALMREEGIELCLDTTITSIQTSAGRVHGVITDNDTRVKLDAVIADVDPVQLYRDLIPTREQTLMVRMKRRFATSSMGLFVLYFGSSRTYPDVCHHTIVLGPRFAGLLEDIFSRKVLPDDFSLYLHRPTATDPCFAPAGHDSFYALVPVPNLSADINWQQQAEPFADRIVSVLDATVLPGLRQTIRCRFQMTPADFQTRYLSTLGSGFSIAPLLHQSAWLRFHNRGEGVNNLYLVGAGTHPGAGLPGVLCSAKVVEKLID
jgi:phytoene desaturase